MTPAFAPSRGSSELTSAYVSSGQIPFFVPSRPTTIYVEATIATDDRPSVFTDDEVLLDSLYVEAAVRGPWVPDTEAQRQDRLETQLSMNILQERSLQNRPE